MNTIATVAECIIKINNLKYQPRTINCCGYKHYNLIELRNDLEKVDWKDVYETKSVNKAWSLLKSILTNAFEKHAPAITKRIKGKPSLWLNDEIKQNMNTRDQLYRKWRNSKSLEDKRAYQLIRNRVNVMIRSSKSRYNKELLKENSNDSNKFWKCLKQIFPTKTKTNTSSKPNFTVNGVNIETNYEVANGFCSYFMSVVTKLKSTTFKLRDFVWRKQTPIQTKTETSFKFQYVSKTEIEQQLKKLQRKKATNDGLPPGMIKDVASVISSPLSCIVNLSLKTGTIPSDWKEARVTPIYKSGPRNSFDNYRPISVLSTMSKILERAVHKQLMSHLESNKLLTSSQFGFRAKRSTQLAATAFFDSVRHEVDKGFLVGALFIDLSKAFDTLSHSRLLVKLKAYGVQGTELVWFTDYLFQRKISVSYGDSLSETQYLFTGVPQGSILGPLLFLIYFNDVADCIENSNIIMYADDTVLFLPGNSIKAIEEKLTNDVTLLADWFEENELIINLKQGKSEVMLFGTPQKLSRLDDSLNISYRGNSITVTMEYKYLGIQIDSTLNLNSHFENVYKKASNRLKLLAKLRHQMDLKTAETIYTTMIVPLLTYYNINQAKEKITLKRKLDSFVERASKIIKNNSNKNVCLTPLENLAKRQLCVLVRNCLDESLPENFQGYFDLLQHSLNTRNNNASLKLPKVRTEYGKRSVKFIGSKIYNDLPICIRKETNFIRFRNDLKKHFK